MKKRIADQQAAFIAAELANSENSRRQKIALQELSRLYRTNHRLAPEAAQRMEQQIVGLIGMSRDGKVVRWGLNTLARLGTKDCTDSVERAIKRYEQVPEIVAAAVSALARLRMGQLSDIVALRGIAPEVQMLAAMQTVDPARLTISGLQIDIAKVDPEVLKLALIIVGLDRDVQHLLDPRHEKGIIVNCVSTTIQLLDSMLSGLSSRITVLASLTWALIWTGSTSNQKTYNRNCCNSLRLRCPISSSAMT